MRETGSGGSAFNKFNFKMEIHCFIPAVGGFRVEVKCKAIAGYNEDSK